MDYIIYSRKINTKKLIETFNKEFDTNEIKEDDVIKYIIKPKNEEQKNKFLNYMSVFLSINKFSIELNNQLIKKFKDRSKIQQIIQNHFDYTLEGSYFKLLTRICLLEFFKNNKELNIDAFIRFNMSGIKAEAKHISNMEVECDGHYIDSQNIFDFEEDVEEDFSNDFEGGEFSEIFNILKTQYDYLYKEPIIKDIHAHFDKKLKFLSENNEEINIEYLNNTLNVSLSFINQVDSPDYINDILLISLIISVFGVKRVIIHKGLPKAVQKSLEYNLSALKERDSKFSIFYADNVKPIE